MSVKTIIIGLVCFLLISLAKQTQAQSSYSVCGFIKDARTGEALIAAVCFDSISEISAISNEKGYFCIKVNENSHQLSFSYLGYKTQSQPITKLNGGSCIINMEPNLNILNEVVVREAPLYKRTLSGINTIPISTIKTLPSFLGEPDILKAVTYLPGVAGGKEGSSSLLVRGGSRDENLILLDGATLYNTNHFGGFISMINPEIIKKVDIYKGAFPSRYGDRLSSVLDIRAKDGNEHKWKGNFNVGLISSSLLLEGPVKKEKSALLLAIRSSYYDLLTLPGRLRFNAGSEDQLLSISFYDVNLKYSQHVGNTGSFYIHSYLGNDFNRYAERLGLDHFDNSQKQRTKAMSIGYTQGLGRRGFLSSSLHLTNYYSRFLDAGYQDMHYALNHTTVSDERKFRSNVQELKWKTLFDFWLKRHHLKTGMEISHFQYDFGLNFESITTENDIISDTLSADLFSVIHNANEAAVFIEDEYAISPKMNINLGLRASKYTYLNKKTTYSSLEPRAALRMMLSKQSSIKLGYAYVTQYAHLLLERQEEFEIERWVSSTDKVPPQRAHQYSFGIFTKIGNIDIGAETYYKKMHGLTESKPPLKIDPDFTKWEDFISVKGKGEAYGLELLAEKNIGKFTGSVAYTLSWNFRQFADQNFGRRYPFTYDRRHILNVVGSFPIPTRKLKISFSWTFQSGDAFSLPTGYIQDNPLFAGYLTYDGKNNGRLPAYHRLDLSVQRKWAAKNGRIKRLTLNLYNAYNRQNALSIYIGSDNKIKQISQFPIIPTISYGIQFSKKK